ncbi:EamA family transporter [Micromonospora lupini]|uniref:EamA family transporter n=1 Tax=Micromonospora lupini TaxID=285679 RepID=UPI00225B2EE9|nr:EamA family transporter [Micromonospora lupini]MCX5064770.1 EamA family transporter [Micromonospora lupini]
MNGKIHSGRAAEITRTPTRSTMDRPGVLQGPVLPAIALLRRGRALRGLQRSSLAVGLGGGLVSLLAYGLVLVAQTSGATAAVAALRETSVVFAAVIGAVFFKESLGVHRVVKAGIAAAGIVLVSL